MVDNCPNGAYNTNARVVIMNEGIKQARINIGLTQDEVSNLIGMPIKTLRNWEQQVSGLLI